jgi:hypothetical protein
VYDCHKDRMSKKTGMIKRTARTIFRLLIYSPFSQ